MTTPMKMTSKERMNAAMRGEHPDRVPVMCQLAQGHIYKNINLGPIDYWYTSEGHAKGFIELAERYRFDGILLNKTGFDPALAARHAKVSEEPPGHRIVWEDGNSTYVPPDEYPEELIRRRKGRPQQINNVDVETVSVLERIEDLPDYYFDILDYTIPRKGATHSIHGEVVSPFSLLLYYFDKLDNGLMALMDDPEKCKELLKKFTQTVIFQSLGQCTRPIDALKISSAYAGAGFISREMYSEFVLPCERAVIEAVHKEHDLPCYTHTCGAIGDRLDLMVESGTDGLECLDPPPLGSVDLQEAVQQVGRDIFIKGNLDSVNELLDHTPEEVKEIARKRIEIGKKAKGYILSSACSVSPRVPPENVEVLYEAVEEFGRY